MTKIEFLQALAKGWFGNSQQHSIQAQLLKQRGFGKLADKIMAESDEEWDEAKKVNARLIELGWMDESQRTGVFDNATSLALKDYQTYLNQINPNAELPEEEEED